MTLYVNGTSRATATATGVGFFIHSGTTPFSIFRRAGSPTNLAQYAESSDLFTGGVKGAGGVCGFVGSGKGWGEALAGSRGIFKVSISIPLAGRRMVTLWCYLVRIIM
jgi:hypothetical protein